MADPSYRAEGDFVQSAPLLASNEATTQAGRLRPLGRLQDTTRIRSSVTRGLQNMSRASKALLAITLFVSLAQVVVSVVVLVLARNDECDSPLVTFLIVYAIRSAVGIPIAVYQRIHPFPSEENQEIPALSLFVERIKNLIDFLGMIWFLIGNYWLYTSTTCRDTSPMLYYVSLTWIVLGYVTLAIPILLCSAMICCLPCVLLAMRSFKEAENHAAGQAVIKAIPATVFRTGDFEEEDAMCVICLNSYVDGENIKKLPCNHHFHAKCIDEWLVINRTCPLCMRHLDGETEHETA